MVSCSVSGHGEGLSQCQHWPVRPRAGPLAHCRNCSVWRSYCPNSGCRSPAGEHRVRSPGLQQPWEEKFGPSLTPRTAYAKGIKDIENSCILKFQNSISSSGQLNLSNVVIQMALGFSVPFPTSRNISLYSHFSHRLCLSRQIKTLSARLNSQ